MNTMKNLKQNIKNCLRIKNKEDNDKILDEIENYKKNISAIDKNIKNIDTLKGEINNYVK